MGGDKPECGRHYDGSDVGTGKLDADCLARKRFAKSCRGRMDERWVDGGATEPEQANAEGSHPQRKR